MQSIDVHKAGRHCTPFKDILLHRSEHKAAASL